LSDLDLNGWMVRKGWSVAYRKYSTAYLADEDLARAEGVNIWSGAFDLIWSGVFDLRWDWRKEH
jgi:endonuclease YncB( thermonuclease family)